MTLDTNHFKEKLLAEKERLEGELSTIGRKNPDNPEDWEAVPGEGNSDAIDPNEAADGIEEFEENTAILRELEARLVEVKDALARIDESAYGICAVGGEEMTLARLEANPAARTCVEHAKDNR